MKRNLLFILFFAFSIQISLTNCFSQTLNWIWAKSATGTNLGEGWASSIDANGNVFVTGYFKGQITFGSIILNSVDSEDIFIAKYDPSGNVLWAKSAGGVDQDESTGISTDANGNAFITGFFYSQTLIFDNDTLTKAGWSFCGNTCSDIFIVKYDASGSVIWAKCVGSVNNELSYAICTDHSGNTLITGEFGSTPVSFDSIVLTGGPGNMFVAKYNSSGNILWAKTAIGGLDNGTSITTDVNNNVLVTGIFGTPKLIFDNDTISNFNNSNWDMFTVKYDSSGVVQWAKDAGGSNREQSYGIAADVSGNVLVTGCFASHIVNFGSTSLTNAGATGTWDFFLVKYNSLGNLVWAQRAGRTGNDAGRSICTDAENIYVAGGFVGSSITFGNDTLFAPPISVDPMFIVEFDSSGTVICSGTLASGGDDQNSIRIDYLGNAYFTSDFAVNPFIVGNDTLTLTGQEDIFTAKFICGATGINEIPISYLGFTLYPNPTNTILNLFLNKADNITITNLIGEIILNKNAKGKVELDVSFLSQGIYFIRVGNEVRKFVKE